MRHNDKETAELSQDVIELSRELATLKRQHEQLRAAAERAWSALAGCPNDDSTPYYKLSWRKNAHDVERLLAAALDATPAEPVRETFDPDAVRAIQAVLCFSDRLPEHVVRRLGDVIRAWMRVRDSEHK